MTGPADSSPTRTAVPASPPADSSGELAGPVRISAAVTSTDDSPERSAARKAPIPERTAEPASNTAVAAGSRSAAWMIVALVFSAYVGFDVANQRVSGTASGAAFSVSRPASTASVVVSSSYEATVRVPVPRPPWKAPMPCDGNPPPQQYLIEFDCANGKPVEVSDLTLIGNDDDQSELERIFDGDNGLGLLHGCMDFKIHDAAFNKFSNAGISVRDGGRGVIYQNEFFSNFKCQDENTLVPREDGTNWKFTEPIACLGYGVAVYGDDTWSATIQLGTPNAVFIEDNVFSDNRHAIASNYGSNYVVRYNEIAHTERARNFGIVDAHGSSEYGHGSRSWEVYHNTLIDNTTTQWNTTGILMRGGDGVVFDNIVPSTFGWGIGLTTEDDCDTAVDYPQEDQTRSAYIWGNHAPDSDMLELPTIPFESYAPACLQEGRDFFMFEMPNYVPYLYPHPLRDQPLF